ncbi:hypothetical protein B0H13DRAFT_1928142 [Mycena leptocephala]|nr:hypothetical protein B0H13DRAFT_1928142 [Mycena leptocephala]
MFPRTLTKFIAQEPQFNSLCYMRSRTSVPDTSQKDILPVKTRQGTRKVDSEPPGARAPARMYEAREHNAGHVQSGWHGLLWKTESMRRGFGDDNGGMNTKHRARVLGPGCPGKTASVSARRSVEQAMLVTRRDTYLEDEKHRCADSVLGCNWRAVLGPDGRRGRGWQGQINAEATVTVTEGSVALPNSALVTHSDIHPFPRLIIKCPKGRRERLSSRSPRYKVWFTRLILDGLGAVAQIGNSHGLPVAYIQVSTDRLDNILGIKHSIQYRHSIVLTSSTSKSSLRILALIKKRPNLGQIGQLLELQTGELRLILRGYDRLWKISSIALESIASTDPSPDLLPLIQCLNPNFVSLGYKGESVANFWSWLKLQKFTPQPQGLIDLWDDYAFMLVCEELLLEEACDFFTSTEEVSSNSPEIVSQVSLNIDTLRILYAYRVTATMPDSGSDILFRIRFLLGLSWDELRAAMCALRQILGQDITQLTNCRTLRRTCILDETVLATLDTDAVLAELAKGSLRHIRAMIDGQIDKRALYEIVQNWGFFVRACPPSPELLDDLSEFAWFSKNDIGDWAVIEDLHSTVRWLKTFRVTPKELLDCFERELEDNGCTPED